MNLTSVRSRLATPLLRRLLRRPDHFAARAQVAAQFIKGAGIEIGASHWPTQVPAGAAVTYVELPNPDVLHCDGVTASIRSDLESLGGVGDQSQDFVIANHVLEHVENPLRALVSIGRVLRPGGIALIALPDKRYTFDKRRAITPFEHILRDYLDGPENSRAAHYLDWVSNVKGYKGVTARQRASEMEQVRADIHFHVWDRAAMAAMFAGAAELPEMPLAVCHCRPCRGETIWVLCSLALARERPLLRPVA